MRGHRFINLFGAPRVAVSPFIPGAIIDEIFTTGQFFPRPIATELVDTRATTKFVTNASGLLSSVAINTLPISNAGMLNEPAGTNAILQSQGFSNGSVWGKPNVTVVDNAVISPDGTVDASTIIPNAAASTKVISQNVATAAVAGQFQTYSFYVKKNGYNFAYINVSDNTVDSMSGYFDLNLGTVLGTNNGSSASWTNISATITPVANGFFRVTLTGKDTPGSTVFSVMLGVNSATGTTQQSFVGDAVSGIIAYGAQAEIAAAAVSSYFPTTAAAATRAADSIVIQRTGIGRIVFTFDDNSQQTVSGINTAAQFTIPTNLNRPLIKRMTGFLV